MKFAKPFKGVPDGEIYPVDYQPGDECPPELEASASALEALETGTDNGTDNGNAAVPPTTTGRSKK